jgi:hypothetical protein
MISCPDFQYRFKWSVNFEKETGVYYAICKDLNCSVFGTNTIDLYQEIKQATNAATDLQSIYGLSKIDNLYIGML